MNWNGGWRGNWDGGWHGDEGGGTGPTYVYAELIVSGVATATLTAHRTMRAALVVNGLGEAVMDAELDGGVIVQPPPAGNVIPIRRIKPMRPIIAPAYEWDTDEDEALLLMIGAL